jgi:hypothetical protein
MEEEKHKHYLGMARSWTSQGIIDIHNDNFKTYYKIFRSTKYCDYCNRRIVGKFDDKKKGCIKCLEHDHDSGYVRGVVCISCNSKKAWEDSLIRFVKDIGLSFSF